MEPRPPEDRSRIPKHWQFRERNNPDFLSHLVSVQDSYLSLISREPTSPYSTFEDVRVEYFFDKSGNPVCMRESREDSVEITLATDIPLDQKSVRIAIKQLLHDGSVDRDLEVGFKKVSFSYNENNRAADVSFFNFIEGFSDNDEPPFVDFHFRYSSEGELIGFSPYELVEDFQHMGWKITPDEKEYILKKDGENRFVFRTYDGPNGLIVAEQEYRKSDSAGFGTRKIVRGEPILSRENYNQIVFALLTDTHYDYQRDLVVGAPWRNIGTLLGNFQLAFTGPFPALLRELRERKQ